MPTPIRRNGRFDDVQVGRTDEVFFKGRVTDSPTCRTFCIQWIQNL
jgi:hypothetical protein